MNNSRLRNTVFALGIGAGTLAAVFGAPSAMAATQGAPPGQPPGQAQMQETPPKPIPAHNPWKLHLNVKDPDQYKSWRVEITAFTNSYAADATTYKGKFATTDLTLDYRATGPSAFVSWTVDIKDQNGTLVARQCIDAAEQDGQPSDYTYRDLGLGEHMSTSFHFVAGHPELTIFA